MLQPPLFHINQFNGTIIKTKPLTPLHLRLFQLYKHRFRTPTLTFLYTKPHERFIIGVDKKNKLIRSTALIDHSVSVTL